jgi:hypothetical protein
MAVTGIGGVFFRARDPDALRQWYRVHLGVGGEGYTPWEQAAGPTLFMPFASDTDTWPGGKQWMINFRVADLDALLSNLRLAGMTASTIPKEIRWSCGSRRQSEDRLERRSGERNRS